MAGEGQRPLVLALVASLVLHALALSLRTRVVLQPSPGARPIAVRLANAAPAAASPIPIAIARPQPAPKARLAAAPPQAPIAPPTPSTDADAPAPAADPGAIARYRYEVIWTALRYKRDAPPSIDGTGGDVALSIGVRASGERAVSVTASSGQALLDAHALEMFRLALGEVVLPPALRGQDFALDVRAVYSPDQ